MAMWYAQRVMSDENIMIAFYALVFLLAPPNTIIIMPIFLRAVFIGSSLLEGFLRVKIPFLRPKFNFLFDKVLSETGKKFFTESIATMEVFVGLFLIVAIFLFSLPPSSLSLSLSLAYLESTRT